MEYFRTEGLNDQVFAIFLDMLGFSDLVEAYPHTVIRRTEVGGNVTTTETTPVASVFQRFHGTLENHVVLEAQENRPSSVMIFSDSAFMICDNALLAALTATELMRKFIALQVPVRMGLAYGTCSVERFTSDAVPGFRLTRAMFLGTAIVRSHLAEHRGGKGCRIFVHPSMCEYLTHIEKHVKVLPLPVPNDFAAWELCYLDPEVMRLELNFRIGRQGYVNQHLALIRSLRSIESKSERLKPLTDAVRVQYSETFVAIDRMRDAMGLRDLSIDEAEESEDEDLANLDSE